MEEWFESVAEKREHIATSEDVVVSKVGRDLYNKFCATGKCELSEGNDVEGDIQYALGNGVATSLKYKDFVDRYLRYRDAEQKTLEGLERDYQNQPWYVKLLYNPRTHWAELQQEPTAKKIIARAVKKWAKDFPDFDAEFYTAVKVACAKAGI